jgi:hypothetical protein
MDSQFAMEQRHITRVMFSAVVHQSRTATATVMRKEVNLRMTTRASKRRGGRTRALPGIGWGRQGRDWRHATNIDKRQMMQGNGPPIP